MKKMKLLVPLLAVALVLAVSVAYLRRHNLAVLNPKGTIASKERRLMIYATALMLIVVVPVYIMTFGIAWRYREGNKNAKYMPDWDGDRRLETAWWAVPGLIIMILAVITWQSSHALDPFRPLSSNTQPLTIQVVALDWKWLFIYPNQNIASVNYFQFPVGQPVNFEITSDAPMNSFWIPQLGGQIYAMSGMSTHLSLEADTAGSYYGSSANISGQGFAGMHFTARASSKSDFDKWVATAKQAPTALTLGRYNQLAQPSQDNPVTYYSAASPSLYAVVVEKFMGPAATEVTQ